MEIWSYNKSYDTNDKSSQSSLNQTNIDHETRISNLDILASDKFNDCYKNIFGVKIEVVKHPVLKNIKSEKFIKGLKEYEEQKRKNREVILKSKKEICTNRAKSFYYKNKLEKNFSQKYLDNFIYNQRKQEK